LQANYASGHAKKKQRSKRNDIVKSYRQRTRKHRCAFCDRVFDKAQALGGHMSKAHPHMSEDYRLKQQIRKERAEKRKKL
jgi:hypothetical protein